MLSYSPCRSCLLEAASPQWPAGRYLAIELENTSTLSGLPKGWSRLFRHCFTRTGVGALGRPRGMVQGGRREEGAGWETRVYLWRIHVDIWQNQYNIVKLNNKIKFKKMLCWNPLGSLGVLNTSCPGLSRVWHLTVKAALFFTESSVGRLASLQGWTDTCLVQ